MQTVCMLPLFGKQIMPIFAQILLFKLHVSKSTFISLHIIMFNYVEDN